MTWQVDMMGHQHVCVYGAITLFRVLLQPTEIPQLVLVSEETCLTVVAALNQV
jgi:hypothetical protein